MANLIHIAEVAALLFVTYGAGWGIGYVLHRLTAPRAVVPVPAERIAAATAPAADALVRPPVVVPINTAPPPSAGEMPAATLTALDELSRLPLAPAPPAAMPVAAPTPPVAVALPVIEAPAAVIDTAVRAEVPTPVEAHEPVEMPLAPIVEAAIAPPVVEPPAAVLPEPAPAAPPLPLMPSARPGEAWAGHLGGRAATRFERPAPLPETVAEMAPDPVAEVAPEPVAEILPPPAAEAAPVQDTNAVPEPVIAPPPARIAEQAVTASPPPPGPPPVYDEDAAMRAIEGGWSRRAARALPDAPELIDVSAAVAKAQSAVQQVLVQSGIDPDDIATRGRPAPVPRPRDGTRDNLKEIVGLSQLDEMTLNNFGIYHFEQIAAWEQTEVLWLENHAFARGRIGRENWQAQAQGLIAARKRA